MGPGHPALVSVGVRPTFHGEGRGLVEVYLLDWDGDLYGAELGGGARGRLREERRFDDGRARWWRRCSDEARLVVLAGLRAGRPEGGRTGFW